MYTTKVKYNTRKTMVVLLNICWLFLYGMGFFFSQWRKNDIYMFFAGPLYFFVIAPLIIILLEIFFYSTFSKEDIYNRSRFMRLCKNITGGIYIFFIILHLELYIY